MTCSARLTGCFIPASVRGFDAKMPAGPLTGLVRQIVRKMKIASTLVAFHNDT
jgi:hypothetical protein